MGDDVRRSCRIANCKKHGIKSLCDNNYDVELGSRKNKAHHMLKKAASEHGDEYKAIARAAFGK